MDEGKEIQKMKASWTATWLGIPFWFASACVSSTDRELEGGKEHRYYNNTPLTDEEPESWKNNFDRNQSEESASNDELEEPKARTKSSRLPKGKKVASTSGTEKYFESKQPRKFFENGETPESTNLNDEGEVASGTLTSHPTLSPTPKPAAAPKATKGAPSEQSLSVTKKYHFESAPVEVDPFMVKGDLQPSDIQRVINANLNQVKKCYEIGLTEFPAIEGEVITEFFVAPSGKVLSSKLIKSNLDSAAVQQCILQAIKTWKFPKSSQSGKTQVTYPFRLTWESNPDLIASRMGGCWDAQLPRPHFGSFRALSVSLERNTPTAQALIYSGTQTKKFPAGAPYAASGDKLVFAFPMEVKQANLTQDNFAMVLAGGSFKDKVLFAGKWQSPSSQMVGTLLYRGNRSSVIFTKRSCQANPIQLAAGLEMTAPTQHIAPAPRSKPVPIVSSPGGSTTQQKPTKFGMKNPPTGGQSKATR
jgi:TonB family protein